MKPCLKVAFRPSSEHAEDDSVEGLELIAQALRDKLEGDFKLHNHLFHGFDAMRGKVIE
jgi:hypothetical protein